MNNYQKYALSQTPYLVISELIFKNNEVITINEKGIFNGKIVLKHAEDYRIKTHYLLFPQYINSVIFGGQEHMLYIEPALKVDTSLICIPFDFQKKNSEITLIYSGGIVDPINLPLEYIEADKNLFDNKQKEKQSKDYEEKASIKVSTGTSLVNVFFQPCCNLYVSSEIELYLGTRKDDRRNQPGDIFYPGLNPSTSTPSTIPGQKIGKYEVDKQMLFQSISGLARGTYGIKLTQFAKGREALFTSDYIFFDIK